MRLVGAVAMLLPGCSILLGFDDPVPGGDPPDAAIDAVTCGNSRVDIGEDCDDGLNVESGPCPACRFATCGDGFVRSGVEECEPGVPGSVCTTGCLTCNASPTTLARETNLHCYSRFDGATTYDLAAEACRSQRAHLVTLRDAVENVDIAGLVSAMGATTAVWMGMTDRTVEGTFTWETDEPLSYTNWAVGAPDNGAGLGENCGAMGPDGTWNDVGCDATLSYLCEQHPWRERPGSAHAYLFLPGRFTWDDARRHCQELGADLATITTGEEEAFVAGFVEGRVWLGANDVASEGAFVWVTGEPFGFSRWNAAEPSDTMMLENCIALLGDAGGTWIDTPCTTPHPALCEVGP